MLLATGSGAFAPPVALATAFPPIGVTVVDDDGDLDLIAVINSASNLATIFRGNGDGTFGAAVEYALGGSCSSVAFVDHDEDGHLDLALSVATPANVVALLLGDGLGGFVPGPTFDTCSSPLRLAVADVDLDGRDDLLVSGGEETICVLRRTPTGYEPARVFGVGRTGRYCVADFDQNGAPDVATPAFAASAPAGSFEGVVVLSLNRNSGPTAVPEIYCTASAGSDGCVASIATSAPLAPISGNADYQVLASGVAGLKNGLLFAGTTGPTAIPFGGGVLCVAPPLKRGPLV